MHIRQQGLCFQSDMVKALDEAEKKEAEIDATESVKLGVGTHASQQLQGFLKDKTCGTAGQGGQQVQLCATAGQGGR